MSNTPHELHEALPEHVDLMHRLKGTDAHFTQLAEKYHDVNGEIHRGETDVEPMDDFRMNELRKRRLALLDEISAYLRTKAA